MAGLKKRYGPQRGISSGTTSPRSFSRAGLGGANPIRGTSPFGRMRPVGLSQKGLLGRAGINIQVIPRVAFVEFDRSIIKTNWKRINRGPLQRAANLIRMIARGSIRRVSKGAPPSPAGQPPRSRFGSGGRKKGVKSVTPPFKMIFNIPDSTRTRQYVGMVGFNRFAGGQGMPVPGLHELGGRASRLVLNPHRGARPRDSRGRFTKRTVPNLIKRGVRYPKRSFMVPAVKRARSRLPGFWRNSVRRGGALGFAARPV